MDKSEYLRMYTLESNFWWYKVLHELVESTIAKNKGAESLTMFDAGCGTGKMMEIMGKYGKISGIDFSEDAIGFAKKRGLQNIEIGDLNDFNPGNEVYDIIVCLDVLYHAGIQDDLAVVEKLRNALKKGGILILNLPAFEYLKRPHDLMVHTKKRYSKNIFVNDLKKIGFSKIRSSYRMPHLYFIILISKLLQSKSKATESESDLKELPGWLNTILYKLGRIENWWIKQGFGLPVGSSLFAVAKK